MFRNKLRVCISSFNSLVAQLEANLKTIEQEAKMVAGKADLLVTPECSICGHTVGPEIKRATEPLRGPSVHRLTKMAKRCRIVISAGIAERSPAEYPYNTQVLVGPDGLIGKQRKLHLSGNENCFNEPGRHIEPVHVGVWRIGVVICYDNCFPELHRILALRGCEVVLAPHAARFGYPSSKDFRKAKASAHERASLTYRAAALCNASYYVYVNQVGIAGRLSSKTNDGHVAHAGGILAVGPSGDVVAKHRQPGPRPERVFVELDRQLVIRARHSPSQSLNARRPALFADLAKPGLVHGHRRRYAIARHGAWWQVEGQRPRRIP